MFKLIFITLLYYCLSEVAGAEPASPLRQQPRIFPNKLWVFWNSDINKAPIFTQLCVNNIRHYAEISGWELILLNNENIYEYLTSDSSLKILDIRDKRSDLLIQALADIYRIFILHDNGGMWLDITSVLLHDLSWVENIGNQKMVDSKLSSEPEMIMYVHNKFFGGNKTVVYDQKRQKEVLLFPGLENWSFISKPGTQFLKNTIERLMDSISRSNVYEYIESSEREGNIYLKQRDQYFFYGSFLFQDILQRKQREIDQNPASYSERYAIEYYQIWTINGVETAYLHQEANLWIRKAVIRTFFYDTLETLTQQNKKSAYFLKFYSLQQHIVNNQLNNFILGEGRSCFNGVRPFPKDSMANKYLFPHSQHLQFVKKMSNQKQCHLFQPEFYEEWGDVVNFSFIVFIFLFFMVFLLLWFFETLRVDAKEDKVLENN